MIPTKLTIAEVFTHTKQYMVPLYQRPYVWTREGQWEPLWEDIEEIAARIATNDEVRPHFLGAVVLAQHNVYGNEIPKRAVIDGQQRLTTLQILLAVLRDEVQAALKAAQGTTAESKLQALLVSVSPLTLNVGLMKGG